MGNSRNTTLLDNVKALLELLLNDVKLTATEKLSKLVTSFSLVFVVSLLGLGVLLFLSYAMAAFFATIIPDGFANMIVAGMYLLFILLVIIFRRPLLEDPVTRLLSKVILSKPMQRRQTVSPIKPQNDEKED